MAAQQLARGLGWFSIGLGAAELLAPKRMSKFIGLSNHATLIRLMGMREIAAGIGVLMEDTPARSMTARVGGDALDLALLGAGMISNKNQRGRVLAATAAVAGVTALDVICRRQLNGTAEDSDVVNTVQSIAVNRSPDECYQFWRNLENLPRFMQHVESVHVLDDRRSHWAVKGPGGITLEWDAEITDDLPNEAIAWQSLEGADVKNSGWVKLERAPAGHGTFVKAQINYEPPAGKAGVLMAKALGKEPGQLVKGDLRRFKHVIETGEIPTIEGQSHGPRTALARLAEAFDRA
ncbi:MAG TPA: SRPBCC family protein [Bryobacteraceae bacterium]|nr:SRPBCC family protein [Bryobacteraceae bacterium]